MRPKTTERFALLKRSEQRYKAILDSSPAGILAVDPRTRKFVYANPAAAEMFGYSVKELLTMGVSDIHHIRDLPLVEAQFRKMRQGWRGPAHDMPCLRKDGTYFYADINETKGIIDGKMTMLGYFQDVTERKTAMEKLRVYQEQLKNMASELSLTEERERRRIAEVLHDNLGPTLSLCKMELAHLRSLLRSPEADASLQKVNEQIQTVIDGVRSLTNQLSPSVLYQLGLGLALQWLGEDFRKKYGLRVDVTESGGREACSEDVRILLFKIVRELLLNVVKHAQTNTVGILVRTSSRGLTVTVEDQGIGFDPRPVVRGDTAGMGLFIIRERVTYHGGKMTVDSAPGRGVRVTVRLPAPVEKRTSPV